MSDALNRHRELVQRFPDNELARFSLAKAMYDAGDFAPARTELEFCLQRKPDWMVAWILTGHCQLALGQRDAAKAAFTEALRLARAQRHRDPAAELEELLRGLD